MSAILTQMGLMVCMMLTGVVCVKLKQTGPMFNKANSGVVMNVFLAFTILYSAMNLDLQMSISEILWVILLMALAQLLCAGVGFAFARLLGKDMPTRNMFIFSMTFSNTVFVAFPVIESIYGSAGIFCAALSNIAFNVMLYTGGISLIRGDFSDMKLRKMISSPLVATLIAVVLFVSGIKVPSFIVTFTGTMSKATVPMCMLIIGTALGSIPLKKALLNWRVYLVCIFRLLICPIVVWAVFRLFVDNAMVLAVMVILSSAPVGIILTIFAVQFDRDEAFASECVFMSTAFSAVTMPFIIWLLLM